MRLARRGLSAGVLDISSEGKELIHFRDLERPNQAFAGADDDELAAGVVARDVGAYQAADARGVNIRNIGDIDDQQLSGVGAHHRLEQKEVSEQQGAVQAKNSWCRPERLPVRFLGAFPAYAPDCKRSNISRLLISGYGTAHQR